MDVTFMSAVVTSGSTMLTDVVGGLFTFIGQIIPILLGLAAVGFVIWGLKWVIRKFRRVH